MNSWFTISLGLLVQQHITNSLFNQVIYTVQHTSPFPQGHHVKRVYSYRGVRPREKLKDPVIRGGISPTITACLCTWRHVRVRVARKRKSIFAPLFMLFQFYFSLFAYVFICAFTFFFSNSGTVLAQREILMSRLCTWRHMRVNFDYLFVALCCSLPLNLLYFCFRVATQWRMQVLELMA